MFDFDALDEALDELEAAKEHTGNGQESVSTSCSEDKVLPETCPDEGHACAPPAAGCDSLVQLIDCFDDDGLSEVWPGEELHLDLMNLPDSKGLVGVTFKVVDSDQVYPTNAELAMALGVHEQGYVPGFQDVRNGDMGVLLAAGQFGNECYFSSPTDAVAMRLNRNNGIVCMGRIGVQADDPIDEHIESCVSPRDDAGCDHEAWEVIFGPRIVVRLRPRLDAAVVGIGSKNELFFIDPQGSDAEWVKLSQEKGYILKDGRVKDSKLGMLLEPYDLGEVPENDRRPVLDVLRSAWVLARRRNGTGFLKPPVIYKLRESFKDAVQGACRAGSFCLADFEASFKASEEAIAAEQALALGHSPADVMAASTTLSGPSALSGYVSQSSTCTPVSGISIAPPVRVARAGSSSAVSLAAYNGEVTPAFASALVSSMKDRALPSEEDVAAIVTKATALFRNLQTLVELTVPASTTLHVVGDLHGQFWDLLHIHNTFGVPSKENWYIFNGDFVDRGQFSVEVTIALFAWKVALPNYVHLNRGNHESFRMNLIYGFMQEVKQKYSANLFSLFAQAFKELPLATLVNNSVLVVHGGLARQDGVKLEEIAKLERRREPDEWAQDLMVDLLWSDPMDRMGRDRSPRGAGTLFGPDVTKRFCELNGLTCVIRSHEMKYEGFEWQHNQMCLTVFSAANYCDMCGNFGAVCNITPRKGVSKILPSDLKCHRFHASPHPHEPRNFGGFSLMPQ